MFNNEFSPIFESDGGSGRKIFVSYKYGDYDVKTPVPRISHSVFTARDYVTWLEDKFSNRSAHIYKGEHADENLSDYSPAYIWEHLKDKLFDSSVTIVMISPNMKEPHRLQKSQWIPWEIEYSLRRSTRNGRTSQPNALLGVILPDSLNSYDYYGNDILFPIIKNNIQNKYMEIVRWDDFKYDCDIYIDRALDRRRCTEPVIGL